MNTFVDIQKGLRDILEELGKCFEELDMPAESRRAATLAATVATDRPAKLVVIGEFNSGKSTLVNALCGWSLLPTGITPTTATINVISHGTTPGIHVLRSDGNVVDLPFSLDAMRQFSAQHGEHGDIREVRIEAPSVPLGLVLIDTPGVNDINQIRSEIVYQIIPEADALLFLMDVQQPLKRSEVEFLRDRILGESMVKTIFVLNHVDRVFDSTEISAAIAYVRKNLSDIYGAVADSLASNGCERLASKVRQYATDIPVFTASAKKMLRSSLTSQDMDGDPMGLRSEIFAFAAPEVKMHTVLTAAVGQSGALIAHLCKETTHRISMEGVERDRVISILRRDTEVLRKTVRASRAALQTVEARRHALKAEADREIDKVFTEAAAALEARVATHDVERVLQEVQQEMGRKLESRMEALNERIRQVATECTLQASAFIPLPTAKIQLDMNVGAGDEQRPAPLAELLQNPAFLVLAPLAGLLFGWVGLAAVAFPFVSSLLGGRAGTGKVSLDQLRSRVLQSAREAQSGVSRALNDRLDSLATAVLDILDDPQQRIRTSCAVLCGTGRMSRTTLLALSTRATRLDSEFGVLSARPDNRRHSSLASRLRASEEDSLRKVSAAVEMAIR